MEAMKCWSRYMNPGIQVNSMVANNWVVFAVYCGRDFSMVCNMTHKCSLEFKPDEYKSQIICGSQFRVNRIQRGMVCVISLCMEYFKRDSSFAPQTLIWPPPICTTPRWKAGPILTSGILQTRTPSNVEHHIIQRVNHF